MQSYKFATSRRPWCVWDWNLRDINMTFLESFRAGYFGYLGSLHVEELEGENAAHAAIAIRSNYCHALETLFALLGALVQAPVCIPGWIQKYDTNDLYEFVSDVSAHRPVLSHLKSPNGLTWDSLARFVLKYVNLIDKQKEEAIKGGFSSLWTRLADEFLEPHVKSEYNSIKHGFRAASGGSQVAMRVEASPGVPQSPQQPPFVLGSEFGSSFFEPLLLAKHNIQLARRSANWDPYVLVGRTRLISMSLDNIKSFLKTLHGVAPESVQFSWPADLVDFESVWVGPALRTSSFHSIVDLENISPKSKDEILAVYQQ